MRRNYPVLPPDTHQAVSEAINRLYDHVYDLRDENEALKKQASSQPAQKKAFNDNIQGIKVIATTDSAALQNGFTIRYSTKSGQFEFGV